MKKLTGQISIKKPYAVLITGYDVRVCENIVQLENGQYQYDMTIYTKAEYKEMEEQLAKEKETRISDLEAKNEELNITINTQQDMMNSLVDAIISLSINTTI